MEIPLIDVSGYLKGDDEEQTKQIAAALRSACQSPGFFQIIGHNCSPQLQSDLLKTLIDFFALPTPTKQALHRSHSKCLRGFEATGEQKFEGGFFDQKEGFGIGPELPATSSRFLQGPNQWPSEQGVPGFRETFTAYFNEVHELSKTMFRLMALSLDLSETYFDAFVASRDSISMCRGHRYPPKTLDMAQKSRGIGAHADFGALTLLLQDDIGGLEVFHKPTQTWHSVEPVKGAYVVNIGDMMERWTNNLYQSTLHRVLSPVSNRYRYSVAFFNEGLLDQVIECIPTCLRPGDPPLYEPIRTEDHLRSRYDRGYQKTTAVTAG